MAYPEIKSSPCTPEQIVDLIRASHDDKYSISHGDGVELIEQYAAVAAAEAAIKATSEAHDKTMAVFDEAMSKPLATPHPETSVSS